MSTDQEISGKVIVMFPLPILNVLFFGQVISHTKKSHISIIDNKFKLLERKFLLIAAFTTGYQIKLF